MKYEYWMAIYKATNAAIVVLSVICGFLIIQAGAYYFHVSPLQIINSEIISNWFPFFGYSWGVTMISSGLVGWAALNAESDRVIADEKDEWVSERGFRFKKLKPGETMEWFDKPIFIPHKRKTEKPARVFEGTPPKKGIPERTFVDMAESSPSTTPEMPSNVVPIMAKQKSEKVTFTVEPVESSNVEPLRKGYAVKKITGGISWKPSYSMEVDELISKSDAVVLLRNSKSPESLSEGELISLCSKYKKPIIEQDINSNDYSALTVFLIKNRPDTVFLSAHPSTGSEAQKLKSNPIAIHIMDSF